MYSSSTVITLVAITSIVPPTLAAYTLVDSYTPSNWFSSFHFWDQKDPTNGFVKYQSLASAAKTGLIAIDDNKSGSSVPAIYMGVDHTTKDPSGRASVRISSKKSYNHGLFIFDIEHSPGGICGTWPAFWMLSDSGKWPVGGEIDIFEGANDDRHNKMTLHTSPGCAIQKTGYSGELETANCDVDAPGQGKNMGCGIRHRPKDEKKRSMETFGQGMNQGGGGVWATSWTTDDISVYHFSRANVPKDIGSGQPDPTKWGMPVAKFAGGCKIDEYFKNLNIIFNIAFCGDWAGAAWSSSEGCKAKAPSCQDYVRENPEAFKDAYWMIRSVKVYQEGTGKRSVDETLQKRGWFGKAWKKIQNFLVGPPTDRTPEQHHIFKRSLDETLQKRGWFGDAWKKIQNFLVGPPTDRTPEQHHIFKRSVDETLQKRGWFGKAWKKIQNFLVGPPTDRTPEQHHIFKRSVDETLQKRGFGDCKKSFLPFRYGKYC